MWIIYSILTSLCESGRDVLGKQCALKTDYVVTAFSLQGVCCVVLLPVVLVVGIPEIKDLFWLGLAGAAVTVPIANLLYMKALQVSPLSKAVPLLAINPILTALLAFFFDGILPQIIGWIGLAMVSTGIYLNWKSDDVSQGVIDPFRSAVRDPGFWPIMGVNITWAIGAHISKLMVVNSSPLFAAFMTALVGSVALCIICRFAAWGNVRLIWTYKKSFLALGTILACSNLAMLSALATGYTAYVISLKRCSIIWSSFAGWRFFEEKLGTHRIVGICIMVSGAICIILDRAV